MSEPTDRVPFPRWSNWLQSTTEPMFLLNRRRKLRFVNRAWEQLTGYRAEEAIGWGCSGRRNADTSPIASAMRPPREVMEGQLARVRRAVPPARSGPPWWEITFLPLRGESGLLGIIGKIHVIAPAPSSSGKSRPLAESLMNLRFEHAQHYPLERLAGESPSSERLANQVRLALSHRAPVWLHGESGVGKQTIARILHHHGLMREKTFAAIDCAALPTVLLATMLFAPGGLCHSPHIGTLFLRDVGAMSRDLQERIADGLNEHADEFPRLIIGASRSALEELREGHILHELFTATSIVEMHIPPLRERLEDLPRLMMHLLSRLQAGGGVTTLGWSAEVVEVLRLHPWPGNLPELEEVLQHASAAAQGQRIEVSHLPRPLRESAQQHQQNPPLPNSTQPPFLALGLILEQVERRLITRALAQARGNRTEAAELLGMKRTELWRRLKALGMEES